MADNDPNQTPANNDPAQPPAGAPPANQEPAPAGSPTSDPVKMAEELGRLKKVEEDFKNYSTYVEPILVTLNGGLDKETYDKVLTAHNKRLGVTPPDNPPDNPPATPPPPSATEVDNRNTLLNRTLTEFYTNKKIDLNIDEGKTMDQKVGRQLKDLLDPMGNKTLNQVLADVSLVKLPEFLESAYMLANKDQIIKEAEERGKQAFQQESLGVMGAMTSTSIEPQSITLTTKEREIIAKAGWDEAKYLENKKKLAATTPPS